MAVIKRGDRWQVRLRDSDGKWFPAATFETKQDARSHEAALIRSKDRGAKAVNREWREMTMTEYWGRWALEFRTKTGKGWRISQDQMWRDHVEPILGKYLLRQVTRSEVAKVLLKAEEKGLGVQMRIHLWSLMHKLFQDALDELDAVDTNPVRKSLRPEAPNVVRRFLPPTEARAFLAHAEKDYLGPIVWVMTLAGLRVGEAQALRWQDVDWINNEIFVTRQWRRKTLDFGPVKNGVPIRVPLLPELRNYLLKIKPADAAHSDLVMKPKRHGKVVHYDTIEDGLKRLGASGGFGKITPHELRHTCTELWISERGANIEDIRRLLNHSSEASTRPYIHRTDDRLKRIAERKPELKLVSG